MLLNVVFYTVQMLIFRLFPRAKTDSLKKPLSQTYWTSVKSLSLVQLFETSRTLDCQAPPSTGFSRQEYWSGLSLPSLDQPRQHIKKQRHYFANKCPSSQSYGFSSSHVRMWELNRKERWTLKNWCFWIEVLEKSLESPSDCKEIQQVHPKGDQSWMFIGRTDAEA